MPIRPCIFCEHAGARPQKDTALLWASCSPAAQRPRRLAIPVYRMRVSPVLDASTRILLIDLQGGREVARKEIQVTTCSLAARAELVRRCDVDVLICAGISQQLDKFLREAGIELISGIVGDIEKVITGFVDRRLDQPSFRMPGFVKPD